MKKVICLVFMLLMGGCATNQYVPAEMSLVDYEIQAPKERVFDAALKLGQKNNLNVAVLEKQSGLLRFETASLVPWQLDAYCKYPFVNPQTRLEAGSFTDWNNRSVTFANRPVTGKVNLTLLLTSKNVWTNLNIRSNWTATNGAEVYECTSRRVFENVFAEDLVKELNK